MSTITDRLWPRIDTTQECWLWCGGKTVGGYGIIGTGRGHKTMYVHRLMWMLCYGDPGELHVLHQCDVPACCRPEHLFLGTHQDNMRDMDKKRRCVRVGERGASSQKEQEEEILSSPESSIQLAKRLPVTDSAIRYLRRKGGYRRTDEGR